MKIYFFILFLIFISGCTDSNHEGQKALLDDMSDIFSSGKDKYLVLESSEVIISSEIKEYEIKESNEIKIGSSVCFILEKNTGTDDATFQTMNEKLNNAQIQLTAITSKGVSLVSGEITPTWELDGIGDIRGEFSACIVLNDSGKKEKKTELSTISISATNDFDAYGIYVK